jgi:exonuclease SbcD
MGFGEGQRGKSLCLVDFQGAAPSVELVEVPAFQRLARLEGDLAALKAGMGRLSGTGAWLELILESGEAGLDPRPALEEEAARLGLEIVRIRDDRFRRLALAAEEGPDLSALSPAAVFESLLETSGVAESSRAELRASHAEVLAALLEEDALAE